MGFKFGDAVMYTYGAEQCVYIGYSMKSAAHLIVRPIGGWDFVNARKGEMLRDNDAHLINRITTGGYRRHLWWVCTDLIKPVTNDS